MAYYYQMFKGFTLRDQLLFFQRSLNLFIAYYNNYFEIILEYSLSVGILLYLKIKTESFILSFLYLEQYDTIYRQMNSLSFNYKLFIILICSSKTKIVLNNY